MREAGKAGMKFESSANADNKTFTIEIPIDVVLTLKYDESELKKMQKFDKSDKISDKLRMLALMASKVEKNYKETTNEPK